MNHQGLKPGQDNLKMINPVSENAVKRWIEILGLLPHPEGGWYKEVYRSQGKIPANALSEFRDARSFSTSIYFLLEGNDFSAFHRIRSDEIWHFYDGSTALISAISPEGNLRQHLLGKDFRKGESLQVVIPAGWWFASKVVDPESYVLAGCTVAPGFDFNDFELGRRAELVAKYPHYEDLINQLSA
jgi:uncharacterized protein